MKLIGAALLLTFLAIAQQPPDADVIRVGPGVTPPTLKHKEEPKYSQQALTSSIQGLVLLEIVINEQGLPQDIKLLSPLGFGLDEKAIEAVSTWRFKPGIKDGRPVKIRATVEISFRLLGLPYGEGAEKRRTQFNAVVSRIAQSADGKPSDKDIQTIRNLATQKMSAATFLLGVWQSQGKFMPQDLINGVANIQKASDQNYGPAMFALGKLKMQGKVVPKDETKGLELIRDSAVLGSQEAQLMLGHMYQDGATVPPDPDRAKRYFRLCAASANPECQFKLGQALILAPARKESDWLQGIAWTQLAQSHNYSAAKDLLDAEVPKLTPEQIQHVNKLRSQLEHKP